MEKERAEALLNGRNDDRYVTWYLGGLLHLVGLQQVNNHTSGVVATNFLLALLDTNCETVEKYTYLLTYLLICWWNAGELLSLFINRRTYQCSDCLTEQGHIKSKSLAFCKVKMFWFFYIFTSLLFITTPIQRLCWREREWSKCYGLRPSSRLYRTRPHICKSRAAH